MARAEGFNRAAVSGFSDIHKAEFEKHNYNPNIIFTVDETGLPVVQRKIPKVVALNGKRQVGIMTSAERESLVTVIGLMSVAGTYVLPMIIFPRKRVSYFLVKRALPGRVFTRQTPGWINSSVFCEWFDHFIYSVKPTRSDPVLLVVDEHYSRTRSIDLINKARANHVNIFVFSNIQRTKYSLFTKHSRGF
jgi:hypothetical protein